MTDCFCNVFVLIIRKSRFVANCVTFVARERHAVLHVKMRWKGRIKLFHFFKLSYQKKSSLKIYRVYLNLANSRRERKKQLTEGYSTCKNKWKIQFFCKVLRFRGSRIWKFIKYTYTNAIFNETYSKSIFLRLA